jgi:hypothetical protein
VRSKSTQKHSWPLVFLHAFRQQAVLDPGSLQTMLSKYIHHVMIHTARWEGEKNLTPVSLNIELTSSRLTSAVSNLGGWYPFLNHSLLITSAIVILCTES